VFAPLDIGLGDDVPTAMTQKSFISWNEAGTTTEEADVLDDTQEMIPAHEFDWM